MHDIVCIDMQLGRLRRYALNPRVMKMRATHQVTIDKDEWRAIREDDLPMISQADIEVFRTDPAQVNCEELDSGKFNATPTVKAEPEIA